MAAKKNGGSGGDEWRRRRSVRHETLPPVFPEGYITSEGYLFHEDAIARVFRPFVEELRSDKERDYNDEKVVCASKKKKEKCFRYLLNWVESSEYGKLTIRNLWQLTSVNRQTKEWALKSLAQIERPHVFGGDSCFGVRQEGCQKGTAKQINRVEALNWSTMKWEVVGAMAQLSAFQGGEYRGSNLTATALERGVLVLGGQTTTVTDGEYGEDEDEDEDEEGARKWRSQPECGLTSGTIAQKVFRKGTTSSNSFEIMEYSSVKPGLRHDGAADHLSLATEEEVTVCGFCGETVFEEADDDDDDDDDEDDLDNKTNRVADAVTSVFAPFLEEVRVQGRVSEELWQGLLGWVQYSGYGKLNRSYVRKLACVSRETRQWALARLAWLAPRRLQRSLYRIPSCGHVVHASCLAASGLEATPQPRSCPTCSRSSSSSSSSSSNNPAVALPPSCQPLPGRRALPSEIPTEALVTCRTSYSGARYGHAAVNLGYGDQVLVLGGSGRVAEATEAIDDDLGDDFRCNLPSGFIAKLGPNACPYEDWRRPACSGGGRAVTWSAPIAPMLRARQQFGCAAVPPDVSGGVCSAPHVLVCGGFSEESERIDGAFELGEHPGETIAHCEIYYPCSNHWHTFVAKMPQPRDNHACVALLDGRIVATGGRLAPVGPASLEAHRGYTSSCSTFTYSEYGRLPEDPRKAATLLAYRAARERGTMEGHSYDEIQADPARALSEDDWQAFLTRGSWDDEAIPAMTARRSNHAACVVRHGGLHSRVAITKRQIETIVAVGGWDQEHTAEMYDPQLGRWVVLPCRTNYPRKYHAMAAVDVVRERNIDELFVEWIQEKEGTKEKEEKKLKKNGKREEKSTTGAARGKKKGRS